MKAFALSDLPEKYHAEIIKSLAPGVRHPQPKPDAQLLPLGADQDEKGGEGCGRVRVKITRFGAKLLDADNCAGAVKWALDACRHHKLIRDDDPASIVLEVHQVKAPRESRGTLIEVSPL